MLIGATNDKMSRRNDINGGTCVETNALRAQVKGGRHLVVAVTSTHRPIEPMPRATATRRTRRTTLRVSLHFRGRAATDQMINGIEGARDNDDICVLNYILLLLDYYYDGALLSFHFFSRLVRFFSVHSLLSLGCMRRANEGRKDNDPAGPIH